MIKINGKTYPMWNQFVEQKSDWIGGELEEVIDIISGREEDAKTKITGIRLEPNGPDSASFFVDGEGWGCSGDVQHLGIYGAKSKDGWITLSGYGGHEWRIRKPVK